MRKGTPEKQKKNKKRDSIGVLSRIEIKPLIWFINKSTLQKYEN